MAEKVINCTLISRHDIQKNWERSNYLPKQGEIIVYDTDENFSYERFKIGDGVTSVTDLPFIERGIVIDEMDAELEEGAFFVNADTLGGVEASRYALKESTVSSINGLSGDVVIQGPDLSSYYSEASPPPYPVTSVNGQQGDVTIDVDNIVSIEDSTVDLEEGLYLANAELLGGKAAAKYALIDNVVTSINGQTGNITLEGPDLSGFYSETNPPKYPVTSVNGMGGDVTIEQPDLVRIEDAEVDFEEGIYLTNAEQLGGRNAAAYALKEEVVTSINGQSGNVVLEERDLSNYYSTEHQPPYPVTSVNGSTGDIIIPDNVTIPDSEIDLEEGIYLTNAETLGGKLASEYATKEDVYAAIQEALGSILTAEGVGF